MLLTAYAALVVEPEAAAAAEEPADAADVLALEVIMPVPVLLVPVDFAPEDAEDEPEEEWLEDEDEADEDVLFAVAV